MSSTTFLYTIMFSNLNLLRHLLNLYTDNFCTNLCLHANHIFYKMRQFFLL